MYRLFFILLLFTGIYSSIKSQDLPVHEQYMLDWTLVNPSFVGLSESTCFKLLHREQWVGIENSPRTSLFLFKRRLKERTGGYGGYVFSDRNGPNIKHGLQLSGSFQAVLRAQRYNQLILSFGMSVKGLMHILDETQFDQHIYDPIVHHSKKASYVPSANAGVLMSYSKFFLGVTFDDLLQYTDRMYNIYLEPVPRIFMNVHSGGVYDVIVPRIKAMPSVLFKTDFHGLNQLDVNYKLKLYSGKEIRSVYIRYSNEVWIGLSYKQTLDRWNIAPLSFSPSFGFAVGSITFGYLYDIGLTSLQFYHLGSHQLSIGLRYFPDKYVNWEKHHIPRFIDDF